MELGLSTHEAQIEILNLQSQLIPQLVICMLSLVFVSLIAIQTPHHYHYHTPDVHTRSQLFILDLVNP